MADNSETQVVLRQTGSLGKASMVLGVLAFFICWIPFIGIISLPLSSLGLVLGVIGLLICIFRRGTGIGFAIAGSTICAVALFVAIIVCKTILGISEALSTQPSRSVATEPKHDASPIEPIKKETETWTPADQPVKVGDIEVRVSSASIGKVSFKSMGDILVTENDVLLINLELKNVGTTKKVDYCTWRGTGFLNTGGAILHDEFENNYRRVTHGVGEIPVGGIDRESIYPGKAIRDLLLFEQPILAAQRFDLQVDAGILGGTGVVRIRIPRSMVH